MGVGFPQPSKTFALPLSSVDLFQGTTVTAAAGANAKGGFATVISEIPESADGLQVYAYVTQTARDYLVDIALGPAGQEEIIVPNLQLASGTIESACNPMYVPVSVPAGYRVSARCQSTVASSTVALLVKAMRYSPIVPRVHNNRATNYGANEADSGGTGVDPGAVGSTFGAWAEIVAACANPVRFLNVMVGSRNNAAMAGAILAVQVGAGPAGSEVVIAEGFQMRSLTGTDCWLPGWHWAVCDVPAGTRLAARAVCNITDATDRLCDVTLIGYD
jgi:hypothetical protein